MDARLTKLVSDYQSRVAEAVAMLEAAGIPRPATDRGWVSLTFPHRGELPGGFTYYKHGYGCAVDGPNWGVDFDFGAEGQIDGFDAYRLYDFARDRLQEYGFSSAKEINVAVTDAHRQGDLSYSGYLLFYLRVGAG